MSNIENTENIGNMGNIDRNAIYNLSNYGKGMKNYAIAKLIWAVFMIILTVFLQSSIQDLALLNESEIMENAGSIMLLALFVLGGFVGGGIYLIVRYINYLLKLNKASKTSIGIALRTNVMIEMFVLGTYLINAFLYFPLLIVGELVTIALLLAATIYLGKWVTSLSNHNINGNNINQMISSIRIMQIGLIVKIGVFLRFFTSPTLDFVGLIISYIGDIILIVGMLKTANIILGTFNMGRLYPQTEYSNALRNRGPVQRPQPQNSQYPTQSNTSTITPPESKGLCPYCGSSIVDPNSMFCSVCGKKIN